MIFWIFLLGLIYGYLDSLIMPILGFIGFILIVFFVVGPFGGMSSLIFSFGWLVSYIYFWGKK